MSVRKYLFWRTEDGIKTYKVTKGSFELKRPGGEDMYSLDSDKDMENFFQWFEKQASVTDGECIDFCFLSEIEMEIPKLDYKPAERSSWCKQDIHSFFETESNTETYEVFYAKDKCFVCQNGNVMDKNDIKKLYLKCIPEFSIESTELMKNIENNSDESELIKSKRDKLEKYLTGGNRKK